ncbi:hypothetical protein Leryth_019391 [Lithospermum erythrorhizon]|nr:hypothetical protein Leryth_019391 [Lithospermum erythrorhizon]
MVSSIEIDILVVDVYPLVTYYLELVTFVAAAVDDLVTEFSATANAYMRSPCTPTAKNLKYIILPVNAGRG